MSEGHTARGDDETIDFSMQIKDFSGKLTQ